MPTRPWRLELQAVLFCKQSWPPAFELRLQQRLSRYFFKHSWPPALELEITRKAFKIFRNTLKAFLGISVQGLEAKSACKAALILLVVQDARDRLA